MSGIAQECRELRMQLSNLAAYAYAYAEAGDVAGLRAELQRRIETARHLLWGNGRCGTRHPDGIWGCDRPAHTDQWHVSEMGGCWPEFPGRRY